MNFKESLKPIIAKLIITIALFVILIISRSFAYPPCPTAGPCPGGIGFFIFLSEILLIPYTIYSRIGLALIPEAIKLMALILYFYLISMLLFFIYHKIKRK